MASGHPKLLENSASVCTGGSSGGLLRPRVMLSEDDLQIPVCFVRNRVGPTLMRARAKFISYLGFLFKYVHI